MKAQTRQRVHICLLPLCISRPPTSPAHLVCAFQLTVIKERVTGKKKEKLLVFQTAHQCAWNGDR